MSRLHDKYKQVVVPELMKALNIQNPMRVPRVTKVVVNMGIGIVDKDALKARTGELGTITGQRPVITRARKSIANFKLREGMNIGAKVTLRGERMYEFLDRLFSVALPRIRDFRGLSRNAFDGRGNYTMGLKDQTIFPEIDPNNITAVQGMDITVVTTASGSDEARALLQLLGMPFASR